MLVCGYLKCICTKYNVFAVCVMTDVHGKKFTQDVSQIKYNYINILYY